jgi:hypothetical protein
MSVISDWQEARPRDIIQTASELNKVDRTVFPSMVRNELESAFNTASKDLLTGENRNIGAKFRQNVYGNDQQKQNLKAMFRGISEAQGIPPELEPCLVQVHKLLCVEWRHKKLELVK